MWKEILEEGWTTQEVGQHDKPNEHHSTYLCRTFCTNYKSYKEYGKD
jgi:hypothetical protein